MRPITNIFYCATAVFLSLTPSIFAATDTWVGGGADANWGTVANWQAGTAPANNDNLIFGTATQQNNTNNLSNFTGGFVDFNANGFTLNGNQLILNPTTTGIFTNLAGTNILNMALSITPAGKYWSIAPNSEVRLTGVVTDSVNTATSVGWLCLTNGGTVRIMNSAKSIRGMDLFQGTVIIDGGFVDANNDGIRFKSPAGLTTSIQITNNGTLRIGGGGNFRMGNSGTGIGAAGGVGGISQATISSGTLELYGPAVGVLVGDTVAGAPGTFNQNGGLVWGSYSTSNGVAGNTLTIGNSANATGTYNLNGGLLWIGQVLQNAAATNTVFNFNGGTLKPAFNSTTFFTGLTAANILAGGAFIDTTNLNITIGQSLLGVGGLTKSGSGTLTLTGANTYTGTTTVSGGSLVTSGSSFQGHGALTLTNNGNFNLTPGGGALTASTLTMGSSLTNSLTLSLGSTPSPGGSALISVTTLNGVGPVAININGSGFVAGNYPLIAYSSISGAGSFFLGSVPLGLSATLVSSGGALSLNVAVVPKNLEWSGAVSGNWDTSTFNWNDLNNGSTATNYSQSGGIGDAVTFDDNGAGQPNINLTTTVTPSQFTANNNAPYTFSGPGKISGSGSVVKSSSSFGNLTFSTANDYSGGTLLQAGNLYVGNNQALGSGTLQIDSSFAELASADTTGHTLTNAVVLTTNTTIATFGDVANTGVITFNGSFDFGSYTGRSLDLNSDIVLGGAILNTGGGGFSGLNGPGQLIIRGQGNLGSGGFPVTQNSANVIIDGGTLNDKDAWRMAALNGISMLLAVTNGGTLIITNAPGANLKVGYTGDVSANNTLDIAGTVQLFGTSGNGAVVMGQTSAADTLNLRTGGLLICYAVSATGPAITTANFYGGTLRPFSSITTFLQGLTNAFIYDGLNVDTTNLNITIAQPLQAGGAGGLTKYGTGTLTLTGTNTYAGQTVVNAGKLVLSPAFASPGGIVVNANSTLAFLQTSASATVGVPSVTAGSGANSAIEADLLATGTPAGGLTNLILNGSVAVNVSGPIGVGQFPLFAYGTISGAGGLTLGQLPQGTVATLVTNTSSKTIDLLVSSITPTVWTGATNGNWDTTTTNWTSSGVPVAYTQLASVLFNDAASNSTVLLAATMTPSSLIVSNNLLTYQFSGAGGIGGNLKLTKLGTNSATLSTANTFSGTVAVNAGTLVAGSDTAFGAVANTVSITNGATLGFALPTINDLNGLGLQPIYVGGSGVNGAGAIVNNVLDQNNAMRNVTLTGDTTIGGSNLIGLRTMADSDPGLIAHGYKLTKVGPGQFSLNGGTTIAGLTNIWGTDIGNVDIQQGILSFQRRVELGASTNLITVEAGAMLQLFSLNQTIPVPTNRIVMTNAILRGNGATTGDINTLASQITLYGATNAINTLAGGTATTVTILNLNGPLMGSGGAIYDGPINLGGTNTYTGPTVVNSGTTALTASGQLAGTSSILVVTGAVFDVSAVSPWTLGSSQTLSGAGTVNGSVTANGTVTPGTPYGTLTFNNSLALNGTTVVNLGNVTGLTNGLVQVNGTLTYGGQLQVVFSGGTPLSTGNTFQLFSSPSAPSGNFTSINLPAGYTWDTTQLSVNGTITVTGVSNRPHPGFNSVTVSGGNIILSGTNAVGTYVLYGSTNLALPVAQWTPVFTNTFSGSFSYTNSTGAAQMFYLLQ